MASLVFIYSRYICGQDAYVLPVVKLKAWHYHVDTRDLMFTLSLVTIVATFDFIPHGIRNNCNVNVNKMNADAIMHMCAQAQMRMRAAGAVLACVI